MSFKNLILKHSYTSEKDDLLMDFYVPVLKEAVLYKRITGFFSSTSLCIAADGISKFIENGGQMRFIINVKLSSEDYKQIEQGTTEPEKIIESLIIESIDDLQGELENNHIRVLGWMIANKVLEIRVGYVKNQETGIDILHQKVGILMDAEGNVISFSGSNNESASGWRFNSEKFKVFCSWEEGSNDYIESDIDDFELLWNNESPKTEVITFPRAVKEKLIEIAPTTDTELNKLLDHIKSDQKNIGNVSSIKLRDYQIDAIQAWKKNNYVGIFEMATGTGKTYAAIGAINELLKKKDELVIIISVPLLHLLPQWERSLSNQNIDISKIYASSRDPKWKIGLAEKILDLRIGLIKKIMILTTHDTVSSEEFKKLILDCNKEILFVGDEIHGLGSSNRLKGLLDSYKFRLGLSATPKRYFDDIGTSELFDFFEKTVYEFTLERAINEINPDTGETYLTPYEYHPIYIEFSLDELDRYIQISKKISQLASIKNRTSEQEKLLEKKLRERQDIIRNAQNKMAGFASLLRSLKTTGNLKRTLIYCSPQQIQNVQKIICDEGKIIQHKFTSDEDAIKNDTRYNGLTEREYILDNFDKGVYDVLVAIKCLDEGVDVPSTRTAILLSNTGNPKEWIQRRGRVLRRSPEKKHAIIYDFIVLYEENTPYDEYVKKMVESQLKRLEEFAKIAENYSDLSRKIFKLKEKYGIV